ncbi:hypothetical protein V6N13_107807 [Hibiscus sabdariffa]
MKRKKKGGGYNLRKSLACDRAFFTEEAVGAHRSIGMTGSNKSTRSTQNGAKSTLSSRSQINKLSAIQLKRNVKSSALISHSSAQRQS